MTTHLQAPAWHKLGQRTRTMLRWIHETTLLREADLVPLVWPEPVTRQAQEEAFARWLQRRYLHQIIEAGEVCYQLNIVGAKILRNAGVSLSAPTKLLTPRSRPGILLANRVGTGLLVGARNDPRVTGVTWQARPFSGNAARPDGIAVMQYLRRAPLHATSNAATWLPEIAATGYTTPLAQAVQRLIIEIDSGTETQRQLIQRAKGWRTQWEAMSAYEAANTIFLWITTGSIERLNTIWEAWIGHAFLPAFFTTIHDLAADGAHWQPWEPLRYEQGHYRWIWRDLYGRSRSLKPWEMNEPLWRREVMQPVTQPSLSASIVEWDKGWMGQGVKE